MTSRQQVDTISDSSARLRIISFNIAGNQPSAAAPSNWNGQEQVVMTELLNIDPDVICLQESPSRDWAAMKFSNYTFVGSRASHAGYTSLLVKKDYNVEPVNLHSSIPGVMGRITFDTRKHQLFVASVHLEPFKQSASRRRNQVQGLLNAACSSPLVWTGDTNMRDHEDDFMEEILGLTDIWKSAGSNLRTKYSWDTVDHQNDGGGYFNEYYGSLTRQYRQRYNRIYVHGAETTAHSFKLFANSPIGDSKKHFLSDHFGVAADVELHLE